MADNPDSHPTHGSHTHHGMNAAANASSSTDVSGTEADRSHAGISLIKGHDRWQFRWDAGDEATLINRIAELARDPAIPFDWYDAAVVCKHIAQPFGSLKT